uniref:ANTH domain-containing protein n=1 Tax=Strongyloides stercoralis TaxID=6248 RepID=A0A0K0EL35_STRER
MKIVLLLCVLFIAKSRCEYTVEAAVNAFSNKFTKAVPELATNILPKLNEELISLISERNESSLTSLIPKEFLDTLDDLTLKDKLQLMKALMTVSMIMKEKGKNMTHDDLTSAFSKVSPEGLESLTNLHNTLISKGQKVSDGVKDFVKNYIEYMQDKYNQYKDVKDISEIPDNEKIQWAVKYIQGYTNLTDSDRESIGEAFESFKNIVNNEKIMTLFKTINENSSMEELVEIKKQILESLLNGEFNPTD